MFKLSDYFVLMDEDQGDGTDGSADAGGGDNIADAGESGGGEGGENSSFYDSLPDTWRNQMVDSLGLEDQGDKDKKVAMLARFSDFPSMTKSLFDAQDKIRSNQNDKGLPENPTDEQLAEYREANNIPATAEDYAAELEEGLVLGETDERIMEGVYQVAHENNLSNDVMNKLTNAMLIGRQHEEDAMQNQDGVDMQTSNRQMKDTWGSDYQTNVNMIQGLANTLPEEIREDFMNARLADGSALFNSPEMLVFFSNIARTMNPAGTVVPNSNNPTQAIDDEIGKLEARMGDDDWHKDEKAQLRLRSLYDAQSNMSR